jgi:hypothetical protein
MPSWKKVVASGSDASFSSLTVDTYVSASSFKGSFTGSLEGTASQAISSSYALTASYALFAANGGGGGISAIYIANAGVTQGTASYFDFTGAGVTATVSNNTASINIPGGGGGGGTNSGQTTNFTQSVAATTWTFVHNLNTRTPLVQVYDTSYNQIIPQYVSSSNANTILLTFGIATAGYAVASTGGTIIVTGSNVILNQTAPAATWSFEHNLNYQYPVFQIYGSTDEVIIPERIVATDLTSSLIYFPSPVSGKAVATVGGFSGSSGAGVGFPFSGSAVITGSFLVSQSFVDFSKASYVTGSFTGSLFGSASFATSASFAFTASSANSFNVRNSLTASGLYYPTTDGLQEQFLSTDGAGTLSFADVRTLYQNIRNMEAFSIPKGAPLFASGSTGDNVNVYLADSDNPLRMPATLIAGDNTLASLATGRGVILGHIEGVDTTGYTAGTEVYVGVGGSWTATRPTGSAIVQSLGVVTREGSNGMGIVLTVPPANLPNIASGQAWVGNVNGVPTATATASFSVANAVSSSYAYTASSAISASFATFAYSASFAPGFSVSMSQATPALTWSFTHNLNSRNPVVQVYDTTYAQIIPNQIVGMDNSTAEIRFDYAQAGYAVASNGGGLYVTGSTSTLVQTSANVTWSFTHNLNNKYNTYEVYDSNDTVIIPSGIRAVSENNAEIYFATPQTGRAVGQFSGINGSPNAATASFANTASFVSNLVQNVFITGSLTQNSGFVVLTQISQSLNFANDAAAAAGGVPLGGLYRSGNFILIRLS